MLRIYKIAHDSKIYGPGNRDVVWFKGCSLHCKNCINPELWSTKGAELFSVDETVNQLKSKHLTLLGGEPLQQEDILPFLRPRLTDAKDAFLLRDLFFQVREEEHA